VTTSRSPLRLNVGFLLNQPIGTYRDIRFETDQLQLAPDLIVNNLSGMVRISRTPVGLLMDADFTAYTPAECVRCLNPFIQPLKTIFQELYAFRSSPISDSGLVVPEDGNIDFTPLVREYLTVEFPIKPLCRARCAGLCTECGADLNLQPCEHHPGIVWEE
jgi:uncharacterized protein